MHAVASKPIKAHKINTGFRRFVKSDSTPKTGQAIAEHVDLPTRATALGMNNAAITLFDIFTPLIVGYFICTNASGSAISLSSSHFVLGLSIMPLLYLTSLLIAIFGVKETFCQQQ